MKFLDLFAGIGGFRFGMESAGHECVGFCEIDKFARASYKAIHNTEGEIELHDITKVTDEEWRKFRGTVDIICGGFPCQAFSIAGKRKGFLDETRGTLFFEIARAAKEIQPSLLFLENVKGLLSHDKGRTFRTILSTLDELGYDAEWQILNSKDFGVPQNRERVFIIGHLRGKRGREVFPIRGDDTTLINKRIQKIGNIRKKGKSQSGDVFNPDGIAPTLCSTTTMKDPLKIVVINKESGMPRETNRVYSPDGLIPTLNTMQGGGREPKIIVIDDQGRKNKKISPKQVVPTLRAQSHGNEPKVSIPVLTPDRANKRQNGRRFKTNGEPMFTLTAQDRHGVMTENLKIRKITPRECWRLQGFPDWAFDKAQEVNSKTQLYKQAGNSVTVNVIKVIAERLYK